MLTVCYKRERMNVCEKGLPGIMRIEWKIGTCKLAEWHLIRYSVSCFINIIKM